MRLREQHYGIETEHVVHLNELGLEGDGRNEYGPSDYDDFRVLMECVAIVPGRDVFLDFGAGMGRAVVLAATRPFRRVIGVELSPELSETARRNIGKARAAGMCSDIVVETSDATLYEVPFDVTMIYFNNPFYGAVLEGVLTNIQRSLELKPRPVSLVCNLPFHSPFETQIRAKEWLVLRNECVLPSGRQGLVFETFDVSAGQTLRPKNAE